MKAPRIASINARQRRLARIAIAALVLCAVVAQPASSQILQGRWVDEAERSIAKHRMTDVAVVVLDAEDRAVQGATVRLTQTRHDFPLGLVVPTDRTPPADAATRPVLRSFNAIGLDRAHDWATQTDRPDAKRDETLDAWREALSPIEVRFGRVVSADPARNADRLALLAPTELRDALLERIDHATAIEPAPNAYDLYADLLQRDAIQRRLGPGIVHRLFEHAGAKRPDAALALRMSDALSLRRNRELALAVQRFEVLQVPFDEVAIEQRFNGQVQANPLKRVLDETIGSLPRPVVLTGVEVGGPTDIAAALNMETVLRLAFAQPNVRGLYLAGVADGDLVESNAALIDADGEPTAAGAVLDGLFHQHWRSDVTDRTDERGNVRARVFTGWYEVTAALPDATLLRTKAYIPRSDRAKLIVLQVTAAEAGD